MVISVGRSGSNRLSERNRAVLSLDLRALQAAVDGTLERSKLDRAVVGGVIDGPQLLDRSAHGVVVCLTFFLNTFNACSHLIFLFVADVLVFSGQQQMDSS